MKNLFLFLLFLASSSLYAQRITVSGKVSDGATGELMPGVNVVVEGTTLGTMTSTDGRFAIDVPDEQAVLIFSFIGYSAQNITVGKQRQLNIVLNIESLVLEDIVVIGYGVQKKQSVVGAIGTAKVDDIKKQGNVTNMTDALTGLIPGVSVLSISGMPGGDYQQWNKDIFSFRNSYSRENYLE